MSNEGGSKTPGKGRPTKQESDRRASWIRIDAKDPQSSESIRNEKRRDRVNDFGKLRPGTVFRYRAVLYRVGSIDRQTGYVKCRVLGEKKKSFKDFNLLRENVAEIKMVSNENRKDT